MARQVSDAKYSLKSTESRLVTQDSHKINCINMNVPCRGVVGVEKQDLMVINFLLTTVLTTLREKSKVYLLIFLRVIIMSFQAKAGG